jgi:hypothetical protein
MKIGRIILGFIILISAGGEYGIAAREIGSFLSPGIILAMLPFLILCTWLIGSGFSKTEFKIKSYQFLRYFVLCTVLLLFVALLSFSNYKPQEVVVEYNGIKIPIGECIESNKPIIEDENDRTKYCSCMAEKLSNSKEVRSKYLSKLEQGNLDGIIKRIEHESYYDSLGVETCMDSIKIEWNDVLADAIENNIKNELSGTEFEKEYDIDKFCNCLIKEYRKYPFKVINNKNFAESSLAMEINEKCRLLSKK